MSDSIITNGYLVCDDCQRARPCDTGPMELFGDTIAFGPGGAHDMYVHDGDSVVCYHCLDNPDKEAAQARKIL